MEKVWEELRKIEREAEHIHSEALKKSDEILSTAKDEVANLVLYSRRDAEEEANELLNKYMKEAYKERDDALKKNEEFIRELEMKVEKRISEAVKMIFDAVLGKFKV